MSNNFQIVIYPLTKDLVPYFSALIGAVEMTPPESEANVLALLEDQYHGMFVAEILDQPERTIVGVASVQDRGPSPRAKFRSALLHYIFVQPEHRKLGIGGALFEAARSWCESNAGIRWMEWNSTTEALGFYQSLGFQPNESKSSPEQAFFELEF